MKKLQEKNKKFIKELNENDEYDEKEVNLFLKGTVHLNSVCEAEDGNKGLYILEVTDLKGSDNNAKLGKRKYES